MAPIVLDRIDDNLFDSISDLARLRNVSIEEQVVFLLRESLRSRRNTLRERAEAIAALTPKDVVQTDSTLLIREDRDR